MSTGRTDTAARPPLRKALRRAWLDWRNRPQARRLEGLRDTRAGERAFVAAAGPSLAKMDLSLLEGAFVCTVNMSLRLADGPLPGVAMHVVNDLNRFRRFRDEIVDISGRRAIPHRFYHLGARRELPSAEREAPYYFLTSPAPFDPERDVDPRRGLGGSASVVIYACQLLHLMGFEAVHVMGVDLDYGGATPYFYDLGAKDRTHEADPKVQARRIETEKANAEFALMRRLFERTGRRLINAGVGGQLTVLPRMTLAEAVQG
ncbi:MAG: hypothetical protein AAF968_23880 [Pseudomonadota bacterium]